MPVHPWQTKTSFSSSSGCLADRCRVLSFRGRIHHDPDIRNWRGVAQVGLDPFGAGTFIGGLAKADTRKGVMKSQGQNFHVTFGR